MPVVFGEVDLTRGVHDDGREGVLLTRRTVGDAVDIPFSSASTTRANGSGSITQLGNNLTTNPDEGFSGVTLQAAAGVGNSVYLRDTLYGRGVGVRWRRDNSATLAPFSLIVNGVAYKVSDVGYKVDNLSTRSDAPIDYHGRFWVDDLTSDGPHSVEIQMMSDPYGGATRRVIAYGWLGDSRFYLPPRKLNLVPQSPTTVPTTSALIPSGPPCRKLCFYNSDAANARTVTLYVTGSTVFRTIIVPAATAGTSNGYAEHDFGETVWTTNWQWKVDSGTTVTGFVQQGEAR